MPLELRNRGSVQTRQCPVRPPEQERGSVRPCVAELEEEAALLPDHRGSPARVVRLEVDPRGNRDATGNVEVRRIGDFDVVRDAVEVPRPADDPYDVRGPADRPVIAVAG